MGRETGSSLQWGPHPAVLTEARLSWKCKGNIALWHIYGAEYGCEIHRYIYTHTNCLVHLSLMSYSVRKLESKGSVGLNLSEELKGKIRRKPGTTPPSLSSLLFSSVRL